MNRSEGPAFSVADLAEVRWPGISERWERVEAAATDSAARLARARFGPPVLEAEFLQKITAYMDRLALFPNGFLIAYLRLCEIAAKDAYTMDVLGEV